MSNSCLRSLCYHKPLWNGTHRWSNRCARGQDALFPWTCSPFEARLLCNGLLRHEQSSAHEWTTYFRECAAEEVVIPTIVFCVSCLNFLAVIRLFFVTFIVTALDIFDDACCLQPCRHWFYWWFFRCLVHLHLACSLSKKMFVALFSYLGRYTKTSQGGWTSKSCPYCRGWTVFRGEPLSFTHKMAYVFP